MIRPAEPSLTGTLLSEQKLCGANDGDAVFLVLLPADVMAAQPDERHFFWSGPKLPVQHVAAARFFRPTT